MYRPINQPEEKPEQRICEVCGAHALFGYGVDLSRKIKGRWRCGQHPLTKAELQD